MAGLLAFLAGVQSLAYKVPLPRSLSAPLIGVLALLVVVLPTGGLRMVRGGRQETVPMFFDLLGVAALGGSTGWHATAVVSHGWHHRPAPLLCSLRAVAVCAAGSSLVGRWCMRR